MKPSSNNHSAANGVVENAVQSVVGLTRIVKVALKTMIKETAKPKMPTITFIVNHVATIIDRITVPDKMRGTGANSEQAELGDQVWFSPIPKYNKATQLEKHGLFLSIAIRRDEIVVSCQGGTEIM